MNWALELQLSLKVSKEIKLLILQKHTKDKLIQAMVLVADNNENNQIKTH